MSGGLPHHALAPAFSAVILAAGGSTRLGSPKQLARLEGEPLVCRAARIALAAGARRVVVVTGAASDRVAAALPPNAAAPTIAVAHNPDWALGPGSSVRAGVAAALADPARAPDEPLLLLLCDQPRIDPAHLRGLVALVAPSSAASAGAAAAASLYDPDTPDAFGPPAAFSAALLYDLLALPPAQGAKPVLARARARGLLALAPFPQGLADVDTPADAARLGVELGL